MWTFYLWNFLCSFAFLKAKRYIEDQSQKVEKFMSKKSLYSVRKRRKTRHPQIIVDANRTKFKSVTLTHSKTKDKKYPTKTNVELPDNPDLNDDRVSYFARRIITDFKFNYSKEFQNYKLSDQDIKVIIEFLKSKK